MNILFIFSQNIFKALLLWYFLKFILRWNFKVNERNKKRPVDDTFDDIMFNEAGSSNECTGLIPSAVLNEDEYDSYEELMNFNAIPHKDGDI